LRTYLTEQASDAAIKLDVRKFQAIPSVNIGGLELGGKQIRIPSRLLTAADEIFKSIGYRQEINARATRQALEEGGTRDLVAQRIAELRAQPTEEMQSAAHDFAAKQTFTNPRGVRFSLGTTLVPTGAPIMLCAFCTGRSMIGSHYRFNICLLPSGRMSCAY
jgi:hypothetical protein